jgi:histone acetyltransferase (RNA polymerase elongator complex component)
MKRVVPVDLGGSAHGCAVAPPRRQSWESGAVTALVEATAARHPEADIEVGFFHGGFPAKELLDAVSGLPLRLSCHPMDLSREQAKEFLEAGGTVVELEAMSFEPHVLRTCGRDYTVSRVKNMAKSLRQMGFQVGVHLVPGLPGSDLDGAMSDAEALQETGEAWVDFVRIWPALGFEGSTLLRWAEQGRWMPLDVPEAIEVARKMMDICDSLGVDVARVGLQPGHDIPVRAPAGPVHPNLRGEVDSRRFAVRMTQALAGVEGGAHVVVHVHPKDLHLAKGTSNINAKAMRSRYALSAMEIETNGSVARGTVRLAKVDI